MELEHLPFYHVYQVCEFNQDQVVWSFYWLKHTVLPHPVPFFRIKPNVATLSLHLLLNYELVLSLKTDRSQNDLVPTDARANGRFSIRMVSFQMRFCSVVNNYIYHNVDDPCELPQYLLDEFKIHIGGGLH